MYKKIVYPDQENNAITIPEYLYGKKLEVTMVEVIETKEKNFLDDIEINPDFPSIEEIRKTGWR